MTLNEKFIQDIKNESQKTKVIYREGKCFYKKTERFVRLENILMTKAPKRIIDKVKSLNLVGLDFSSFENKQDKEFVL